MCVDLRITLSYGICNRSAFGFVAFAIVSLSLVDGIEFSYRWGKLAVRILRESETPNNNLSNRVNVIFAIFLGALVEPFQATFDVLLERRVVSLRLGDKDTAKEIAVFYSHLGLVTGNNLSHLDMKCVEYIRSMVRIGCSRCSRYYALLRLFLKLHVLDFFIFVLPGGGKTKLSVFDIKRD